MIHLHLAIRNWFLLMLGSIIYVQSSGQDISHLFETPYVLSGKDGLPNTYINGITQDNDGFIWIATAHEGLYRFDGSKFKVFHHDKNDSLSLSNDNINTLYFDSENEQLWIGSEFDLNIMEPKTGECKKYSFLDAYPQKGPVKSMLWITKDQLDDFWISFSSKGLFKYQKDKDSFTQFYFRKQDGSEKGLQLDFVNSFIDYSEDPENDSLLWLGSGSGLLKFNKITGTFNRYTFDNAPVPALSSNSFNNVYKHSNGLIYLGIREGMCIFDPILEEFFYVPVFDRVNLGQASITNILPKTSDELWITTDKGLFVFNTIKRQVTFSQINNFTKNNIYGIKFLDQSNRAWTWLHPGYLFYFDPLENQLQHYTHEVMDEKQNLIVRKIIEDSITKRLYIAAQYGDGLYQMDRNKGIWEPTPPGSGYFKDNDSFEGRNLLKLQNGDWLIIERYSLYKHSPDKKQLIPYPVQCSLEVPVYWSALEDSGGNIWIGSRWGGLVQINPGAKSCRMFQEELRNSDKMGKNGYFTSLLEDSRQRIWIRGSRGYSIYNYQRDTIANFPFLDAEGRYIEIFQLEQDNDSNIWAITKYHGLAMLDPNQPEIGSVKWYKKENGLSTGIPLAVVKDKEGYIWLASKKGLEQFDPRYLSSEFYELDLSSYRDINHMSLLPNGEIAIGYRGGFSIFHPDSLKKNNEFPTPYLTSFQVFGSDYSFNHLVPYIKEIDLKHDENYFSVEFSSIGFSRPHLNSFEYKLEGFDRDWINPGERRYASYTNLKSGDYTFKVKVFNNEGLSNEEPLEINIHIATPWYQTWWAYTTYIILVISFIYGVFQFRLRRRLEQAETLRLKELNDVKTKLYTNITHEFRTPLTVISGMADQEIEEKGTLSSEKNLSNARMIKRNSDQLLNLVNQMLDLRKLESGTMPLKIINGDIIAYLRYIVESFHSYAESKDIQLKLHCDAIKIQLDFDPDKMLNILSNLLSNAIKFTPHEGKVEVIVDINSDKVTKPDKNELILKVKDSGIGIPSENLPHIFDRFYQVDDESTREVEGTGIGLALTRELVKLIGGKISVNSRINEGTEFIIVLPITNNTLKSMESAQASVKEKVNPFIPTSEKDVIDKQIVMSSTVDLPLVLVIEDNKDVVSYLSSCLKEDYNIQVAYNGQEGINKALEAIPDIIISDVMMPKKNGFEVCRTLKTDERSSHIPIVLLTAKANMESKLEGLSEGADAYLPKPFNKKELLIRLNKLLELRQNLRKYYLSLATGVKSTKAIQGEKSTEKKEDVFVQKVRSIVEEHIDDFEFKVVNLCKEIAMSHSQLHRKITALTGYSANKFIRFIRLSKAKNLLVETDNPISEIADDTGFNDPVYFTRVFHKEFGMTPSEFRKKGNIYS